MRAMILAAGLGTRLRPLTHVRPKALAPILGTAILDFWVWKLFNEGVSEIVVNGCHLSERLVSAVRSRKWPVPVHVVEEPILLGTGGGIRNVLDFFRGEPFVVVNGDTVCDAAIKELYAQYLQSGSPVGLVMHDWPEFNNVAVDEEGVVHGFGREASMLVEERPEMKLMAFTGIHYIEPTALEDIPKGIPAEILESYRKLIEKRQPPRALVQPNLFWREMGSLDSYRALNEELGRMDSGRLPPFSTGNRALVHATSRVATDVVFKGFVVVGEHCEIMEGVEMEDTILWDNVAIERGSRLCGCIVTDGAVVRGDHQNECLCGTFV